MDADLPDAVDVVRGETDPETGSGRWERVPGTDVYSRPGGGSHRTMAQLQSYGKVLEVRP